MHGIHHDTCIHHIYTQEDVRPNRKPQCRINHVLKDIVKEELQNFIKCQFYISNF